jgi:hypothetical protein
MYIVRVILCAYVYRYVCALLSRSRHFIFSSQENRGKLYPSGIQQIAQKVLSLKTKYLHFVQVSYRR